MKRTLAITVFLLCAAGLGAQNVKLEYGTGYEYYFENREFDYGAPAPMASGTINGIVLTPGIGVSAFQARNVHHRLNLGVDIRRDMGSRSRRYFDELTINYDGHVRLKNGAMFEGVIGVFPRSYSEGEYGRVFFSDSLRFVDRNLEGALLKYRAEKFYAEIGADWMGQKDTVVKERFMIFSSGLYAPSDWFELGWAATGYHYAGSLEAPGVVDNDLAELFVRLNLAKPTRFQELSLKFGGLLSYQWDRVRESGASLHPGLQAVLTARRWNVSLQNTFFVGDGMQYLYDRTDSRGDKYGNMLYFGDPFYGLGMYDMCELAWTPQIGSSLFLSLKARFHFGQDGFLGNSQMLGFIFDLDRLRHPEWGAGRTGKAVRKNRYKGPVHYM